MSQLTLDALAHRLERVERENRRLKRAASLLLIGLAAVILAGQADPRRRTIEAENLILKDKNGKRRVELGQGDEGSGRAGLYVYDEGGKLHAWVAVSPLGESAMGLIGAEGRAASVRLSDPKGAALLKVEGGRPELGLSMVEEGAATLGVGRSGPQLILLSKERRGAATFEVRDGLPSLDLYEAGQIRATLGGSMAETPQTAPMGERHASSLLLFDAHGAVIWKAP